MKVINSVCSVLVIVGALNWGLWGLAQYDLVAVIFGGNTSGLSRIIYSLVGLSGVVKVFTLNREVQKLPTKDRQDVPRRVA